RGGEYISQEFKDYLKACEIVQQLTLPYIPQHNGVSKRRNRTLLDMVQSMMNLTTLSLSFWDYALESATRVLNVVSTKKVDKTPYELWYGKVPNLSNLKEPKETMGYYFYFPPENKIVVARYVKFFKKYLITQEVSGRAIDVEEIQNEDTLPSEITSKIPMEAYPASQAPHIPRPLNKRLNTPSQKNINSISLTRGEEEKNDEDDVTTSDGIEKTSGSDPEMLVKEAEKENEAKNGTKNEPIKRAEREEALEAPSSQPVGYYLKHMINEKLIERLVDNHRKITSEAIKN
nr:hypothetical protein [Tanacetum cinerariifolium]